MCKYKVIEGPSVTKEDIIQALNLDKIVYPDEYIVSIEQCLAWNDMNNHIYTMIKDGSTNNIIAYVNISPVTEEYYEKIRSGEFIDTLLPAEAIVSYDFPSTYCIYFSSIVIHPDYQNTAVFKILFDAIVNKIIKLGEQEIIFEKMVADAVSDKGTKFCKMFGMKKVRSSRHDSSIYEVQLIPPEFKISSRATRELYEFYDRESKFLTIDNAVEIATNQANDETVPSIDSDFQVFLSYKNTDKSGQTTKEAGMALQLYNALMSRGISTFYSGSSLEIMGAAQYKMVIDEALDKCKVLIVIGTSVDNINSQWVKYEWDSFANDILSGIKTEASIFSYIDNITPHMLPRTLRQSQVFESKTSTLNDICNYISNALNIVHTSEQTTEKYAGIKNVSIETNNEALLNVSKKYIKKTFSRLLQYDNSKLSTELDELTKKYSNLFCGITRLKHNNEVLVSDENLMQNLYEAIVTSDSENILKIIGNSGSEKNAVIQLLYLKLQNSNDDFIPFYINIAYYEKQVYSADKKLQEQISDLIKKDIAVLKEKIASAPSKKPIIFIDGIRDFEFSQISVEHILSEAIFDIPRLTKVVSVDSNFTTNRKRIKKVIALAPSNFEYIAKISSVDLADDEICSKYYEAFNSIYDLKIKDIHTKMCRMSFYEVDAYILRLSANILSDNLYNDAFTISDLYEAICMEMFNGNRDLLNLAAQIAYEYAYTDKEFDDRDLFSSKQWMVIRRHKSFMDYLIAHYYVRTLEKFEDNKDISFFEIVLPKEVTRFVTPMLNDSYNLSEKIVMLAKNHFNDMGILGKSELTFWLGRIKNQRLFMEANSLLQKFYSELKTQIADKEKNNLYRNLNERKSDLFLLRGITVSLIYNGHENVAYEYIENMLRDNLQNEINRGFHLEYYGDKVYIPNKDVMDFEDDIRVGEKTLKRLVKNIEGYFEKNPMIPTLEFDLFTLCSLLQNRIANAEETEIEKFVKYVNIAVSFLKKYANRNNDCRNKKIQAYFNMIYSDFNEFLSDGAISCASSALYDIYSRAGEVKRTGWVEQKIPDPESIVEHMYNTWLLGMFNLPDSSQQKGYSKKRVLEMILLHDLGETVTGDIPKPQKKLDSTYDMNEDSVMRSLLLKGTYPQMTNLNSYYDIWDEWKAQETINSKIAKDLDTLQAIYQFCVYYNSYPDNFSEERKNNWLLEYNDLKTDIGRELYRKLISDNPKFSFVR